MELNLKSHPKTLIVGLGKTGLSCARFLSTLDYPLTIVDSRMDPPYKERLRQQLPHIPIYAGDFSEQIFNQAEQIIVSPGVSLKEPEIAAAIKRGVPVMGDIELFVQHVKSPIIAITGSNGKSTVTTLVGKMIENAGHKIRVGGNLGTPALDLLEGDIPRFYVLELSSFQLETTYSLNAAVAAVLNITPDHMDRYDDLNEYVAAKRRILNGTGTMVLNKDDSLVMQFITPERPVIKFGLDHPVEAIDFGIIKHEEQWWLSQGQQSLLPINQLKICGLHNAANALAALAIGTAINLPMESMLRTLKNFDGLPHRMQWVAEKDNVRWYNDSKGTNVGATLAALRGMSGKVVLIAGGQGKDQDFSTLRGVLAEKGRMVILIGADAKIIADAIDSEVPVVFAPDMQTAVNMASNFAQRGDDVLLSPACASFDMFENYEERGRIFTELVRRLTA